MKKTIAIIEPSPIYRRLLQHMIHSIEHFEVTHVMSGLPEWEACRKDPPDLLLIEADFEREGAAAFELIAHLTSRLGVSCILCTFRYSQSLIAKAFEAGAVGYLLKDSDYHEICANLLLALHGGFPMSVEISRMVLAPVKGSKTIPGTEEKTSSPFVSQVNESVEEYLSSPMELSCRNLSDFLTCHLHLSYGHISTLYRQQSGITLRQHLQEKRIQHALHLIQSTRHSLTEIANLLEFSSVAHFSTSFHRITGMTPSAFRQRRLLEPFDPSKDVSTTKRA